MRLPLWARFSRLESGSRRDKAVRGLPPHRKALPVLRTAKVQRLTFTCPELSQNSGRRRNRNRRHASPPMQVVCSMGVKMTKLSITALFAAAISLAGISAASAAPPTKTGTTTKGPALTDAKGMSLYTFDKDAACTAPAAPTGPALKAEAGDAPGDGYPTVPRDAGSRQWAHKGKPLYTFAK